MYVKKNVNFVYVLWLSNIWTLLYMALRLSKFGQPYSTQLSFCPSLILISTIPSSYLRMLRLLTSIHFVCLYLTISLFSSLSFYSSSRFCIFFLINPPSAHCVLCLSYIAKIISSDHKSCFILVDLLVLLTGLWNQITNILCCLSQSTKVVKETTKFLFFFFCLRQRNTLKFL